MKKYIFYTLLACMPATNFSLANTPDSITMVKIVEQGNKPVVNAINNQTKLFKDSIVPTITKVKSAAVSSGNKTTQNIISFLPVAFFLFIVLVVFAKLKKDGVKLRDILIDKETVQERRKTTAAIAESHAKVAAAAATAVNANPNVDLASSTFMPKTADSETPVQEPTVPEQSTSRLIAFICGIVSIALACCITSFYFYKSFTETGEVTIGNLANVLYGLGLGVLPYGFNKIATAFK